MSKAFARDCAPTARHVGRRLLLCSWIGMALCTAAGAAPAAIAVDAEGSASVDSGTIDATFDRSMLSGAGQNTTDLARFERGDFIPAGSYRVDVFLNERPVGRSNVRFAAPTAGASAVACVTQALLDQLGLRPPDLSPQAQAALADGAACVDIAQLIPGASIDFNMGDLRLDVSVPQAFLGQQARGYVDPKYWDSGVTAGLLNYNLNSYRTTSQGEAQTSSFLGLNAGLNVGRWHFRHDSSLSWQSSIAGARATHHWQSIDTYARRDFPSLRAQLTLGDAWTSGDVFDSIGLRGVQLATDDRMLPQSLRGYAPTVRGVADSNARVTVRQNDMVIYQTTVAPGPFVISDLYATGYGGDLAVSVTEANGRVHSFTVPYASVPQLLRPGVNRFSVAAGQLRDNFISNHPGLFQATLQRGISNLLTGYGGINASRGYAAGLLGSALNTSYGALALDVTAARARIPGIGTLSGESVRLSYSKTLAETGTSLSVAAYRYSTSGFLSLGDAARARELARRGLPVFATADPVYPQSINGVPVSGLLTPAQQAALAGGDPGDLQAANGVDRQRDNLSLTLSQQLGERGGALYVSGSRREYWNRGGSDTQFQIGYNNSLGRMNYNLSASRERDPFGRSDNRFALSLTLPLGHTEHMPVLTGSLAHDTAGGMQEQATLSGTAGADGRFNYGLTATHDSTELAGTTGASGSTASVDAGYRGSHVQVNAGLGAGSGYSQASFNVSGGVVAHPGGIIFSQPLGDTVALIEAPGAAGAAISTAPGVRVGRDGYALVPYVTPFVLDTISIDPTGLPLDVQLDHTSVQVAPRAGAVVRVTFDSESGRFVLIQTRLENGATLPFGAQVEDEQGQVIGVVGQAGRVMARVTRDAGRAVVQWQGDSDGPHRCTFAYHAPEAPARSGAIADTIQNVVCVALPDLAASTTETSR
ncbi:fimbria/pilus outer membrane usher protein [Dyella sp.]|uniref:fimbria/pilus outer membrane usher protein n=1 Tax=Dyella sp. TaxID=1869338 RepID=UPI002D780F19|nr:fimbria/pilus outer membrane usher protein [Dyella sp.]HET6431365.1 fimbria/pilus outer membrane usher protein [Dyella sp.]